MKSEYNESLDSTCTRSLRSILECQVMILFFNRRQKLKVTLSRLECDVIYTFTKRNIHINIGINKKAILIIIIDIWCSDWKKKTNLHSFP